MGIAENKDCIRNIQTSQQQHSVQKVKMHGQLPTSTITSQKKCIERNQITKNKILTTASKQVLILQTPVNS